MPENIIMDELTEEWLEMFEQDRPDWNKSAFWRLVPIVGLPHGVDPEDPRVVAAVAELSE